jgi:hypothetical protein
MDDPPAPTAKRQKTTTTTTTPASSKDEKVPASIRAEERRGATTAKDDRTTVMDLLRSLPPNLVANYIYPFAVKFVKNREELIKAVDDYLDEFHSNKDREAKNDDEDVRNNQRIRYPIGDWDVSRVDNFAGVFSKRRNRKARNFNEDLSL